MRVTRLDLVVIVFIAAVLATIRWGPSFSAAQCRSKQVEGSASLRLLFEAEQKWHAQHHRYGGRDEVGYVGVGPQQRYVVTVISADADTFVAEAVGTGDMRDDVWRIDQTGKPVHTVNMCW
jgi:Tfp pilus assembly protein PilE